MKKNIITLSALGLFALLASGLILIISCHKNDCKDCQQLSDEEKAFICYNQGDKVVFKNDSTNIFDTLIIYDRAIIGEYCNESCYIPYATNYADFYFTHLLQGGGMGIQNHNEIPKITIGPYQDSYSFPLIGNIQTITVNNVTYNDAYVVQIDSTTIVTTDKQRVPWKLYYSKSKGFMRLFMVNGQTWSKL